MFRFVCTPIVGMLRQLHCFRLCVDRGVFSALQQSLVPFHLCGQGYMALLQEPKWQCYPPVHCGRARRGRLPPMWPEYRACGWWQSSQLNSRRRAGSSGAMWITLFHRRFQNRNRIFHPFTPMVFGTDTGDARDDLWLFVIGNLCLWYWCGLEVLQNSTEVALWTIHKNLSSQFLGAYSMMRIRWFGLGNPSIRIIPEWSWRFFRWE